MTYTDEDFERDVQLISGWSMRSQLEVGPRADRIIAAYRDLVAENERLRFDADSVSDECIKERIALAVEAWKARAEAAERVCEATHEHVFGHHHGRDGVHNALCDALAAWEATR